jgi:hypothetical protein
LAGRTSSAFISPPQRHKEVRSPSVRLAMLTLFFRRRFPFPRVPPVMRLGMKTHLLWRDCVGCSTRGTLPTLISLPLESTLAGQTIVGGHLSRLNHTLLTRHLLAATFSSRLWQDGIHLPPSALLWRPSLIGGHSELSSFLFWSTLTVYQGLVRGSRLKQGDTRVLGTPLLGSTVRGSGDAQ